MSRSFIYVLLVSLILFCSCGRKQEEVKVFKNSGIDSSTVSSESTNKNPKTEDGLTSAGEDITKLASSEAGGHIGVNAAVKGYVADVVEREKVAYLNFDKKYPKNTFTAVIFAEKFSEVGDLSIYKNQNVEVKGIITEYRGKPQIIVNSKNQISIVK